MFRKIAAFETRYQLLSWGSFAYFTIFFLMAFLATVSNDVQIGSIGNIHKNSPLAIAQTINIMSILGTLIAATVLANSVLRDYTSKMDGITFSLPLRKFDFVLGRFSGAWLAAIIIFLCIPLGILLGSFMPWADQERFGPTNLWFYIHPFLVFAVPNLLLCGSLFFMVATLTRSLLLTWTSVIGFFVLYSIAGVFLADPELRDIAALADPFAFSALSEATRYWTAFESNTQVIPLTDLLAKNRLIWLSVSLLFLAITWWRFSFQQSANVKAKKRRWPWQRKLASTTEENISDSSSIKLPVVDKVFTSKTAWQQFIKQTRFEVKGVLSSVGIIVLLAFGIFNSVGTLLSLGEIYGTPLYPVTRLMVDLLSGSFGLFLMIVALYYGGELVWHDRQHKTHEIIDASPTPSWVFVWSKFLALVVVLLCLIAVSAITAILVQLFQGYTKLELGLYLRSLVFDFGLAFFWLAVLSIFVQVLMNNKYMGMLVVLMIWLGSRMLSNFGWEHPLLRFGGRPNIPLSDMNGMGHFAGIQAWFNVYWIAAAVILMLLSYLLWSRGTGSAIWRRLGQLRDLKRPVNFITMLLATGVLLGAGGKILHNTLVVNEYITGDDIEDKQVAYENTLRQFEDIAQPKVTAVKVDVDIFPEERSYTTNGIYTLENKTDKEIADIHILFGPDAKVDLLSIDNADVKQAFPEFNYTIFALQKPLSPGETIQLDYKTRIENNGFKHARNNSSVVANGSFFNNMEAMPIIGFNRNFLLSDKDKRRRKGLPELERTYPLEDASRWNTNYIRSDSDFIDFETTVSTSVGQTAIAPGYLQREWTEGDRHYFHYKMDAPILHFYAYLSADYKRAHERWNDIDIDVYHHAPHDYNVQRMIQSVKDSITYFSAEFSPYQHRQMRILEFPDYASFAQAFPNTVPYSEGLGFIADLTDEEAIDYVYYITAHEVAHQWWAHQVMGADVQGGTVLVETLAQYSALMVMEKTYGKHKIRRFLKHELDNYLRNRGSESREELPLYKVENQAYIHYRKGSVVMYALQDYLGEEVVNRALRRLIDLRGYQSEPYATSLDLLRLIREEAGEEHEQFITDMFEKITLYDLNIKSAEVSARDDGRWDITLEYNAQKFYADGLGEQTEATVDIPVDIGVFTSSPADKVFDADAVLYLQKYQLDTEQPVITITVDQEPTYVGIDPYNKLIDRNSDDNLKRVTTVSKQ